MNQTLVLLAVLEKVDGLLFLMAHMKEFGLDLGSNEYLGSFVWREFETGGE